MVERGTGNVLFIQDHELVREVFFPNVHGGLKYVGERLFIPARTGFLERLDLHALQPEITVRAGIYLRNIEVSPEYVIAACLLPPTLVFFDHDLNRRKTLPLDGDPSAVTIGVFTLLHGALTMVPAFLWSMGWIQDLDPATYRLTFWGFGHPAQQINLCAMVGVWYALETLTVGGVPLNEKVCGPAFVLPAAAGEPAPETAAPAAARPRFAAPGVFVLAIAFLVFFALAYTANWLHLAKAWEIK